MSQTGQEGLNEILIRLNGTSNKIADILEARQDRELLVLIVDLTDSFLQLQCLLSTSRETEDVITKAKKGECGMSQWISVKEKMPEPNVQVLVFSTEVISRKRCVEVDSLRVDGAWERHNSIWRVLNPSQAETVITHWMLFPNGRLESELT